MVCLDHILGPVTSVTGYDGDLYEAPQSDEIASDPATNEGYNRYWYHRLHDMKKRCSFHFQTNNI